MLAKVGRGVAHGRLLAAIAIGRHREAPAPDPLGDRRLAVLSGVDAGGREHPAVVGAARARPVLVDRAAALDQHRAVPAGVEPEHHVAARQPRARGRATRGRCGRACRSRPARCARTARTCSTPCTRRTARRRRARPGVRPPCRPATSRSGSRRARRPPPSWRAQPSPQPGTVAGKKPRRASAISARRPAPDRMTSTIVSEVWMWPRHRTWRTRRRPRRARRRRPCPRRAAGRTRP